MSDLEIDQIINDKCRYYAGLVWNDFYTLLSVLDENTDKGELDKCWNDFYFAFWKNGTERPSIIDHLIRIYLPCISGWLRVPRRLMWPRITPRGRTRSGENSSSQNSEEMWVYSSPCSGE